MKLNLSSRWLLMVAICCFCVCCQQLPDELETGEVGTLNVKTRSADEEAIAYPMNVYAFSEDGDCVVSQTVKDEEEAVKLSLPAGKYKVVAIAGYSDDYQMPSEPKLDDVVQMTGEAGAGVPLMMGKADVTVGADREKKLEMELSYVVTAIDIILSNVPSDVMEVSATLSSFHSSMDMNGEYKDTDYTLNFNCSLNTGNQWLSKTRYVFPGSGSKVTLSITMKLKNKEERTYGYVWKDTPEAGQPYHLKGEYSDGFSLTGSFIVTGWNEAEDVKFNFGTTSSPDDEPEEDGGEDNPGSDLSGVPEEGTIWNGTIVADVVEDESGIDLLLMSLDEWEATTSQVDGVIDTYEVNGISDWRLPTHEEVESLRLRFSGDHREELNDLIAEYDSSLYGLANGAKERYLCLKDGKYYSFQFILGTSTTAAGEKRTYYLRLVKSYRIDF